MFQIVTPIHSRPLPKTPELSRGSSSASSTTSTETNLTEPELAPLKPVSPRRPLPALPVAWPSSASGRSEPDSQATVTIGRRRRIKSIDFGLTKAKPLPKPHQVSRRDEEGSVSPHQVDDVPLKRIVSEPASSASPRPQLTVEINRLPAPDLPSPPPTATSFYPTYLPSPDPSATDGRGRPHKLHRRRRQSQPDNVPAPSTKPTVERSHSLSALPPLSRTPSPNPFFGSRTAPSVHNVPRLPPPPSPERWYQPSPVDEILLTFGRAGIDVPTTVEEPKEIEDGESSQSELLPLPKSAASSRRSMFLTFSTDSARKLRRRLTQSHSPPDTEESSPVPESAAPSIKSVPSTPVSKYLNLPPLFKRSRTIRTRSVPAIPSSITFSADPSDDEADTVVRRPTVGRSRTLNEAPLSRIMAISDDATFLKALGVGTAEAIEAPETRSAFIIRELLATEQSYARHLRSLLQSLNITASAPALPMATTRIPLFDTDLSSDRSLLPYLAPPTPPPERPHSVPAPSLPVSPRALLLRTHLVKLLDLSDHFASRCVEDPSTYGIASAFVVLEEEVRSVYVDWSRDAEVVMEAVRSQVEDRLHRRSLSADSIADMTRRMSNTLKRPSKSSSSTTKASSPSNRHGHSRPLTVADVLIMPIQRIASEIGKNTPVSSPAHTLLEVALAGTLKTVKLCDAVRPQP